MRLGVLVPCHNEREVVERKLANLAWVLWPAGGPHRVVLIDDGSDDGTGDCARHALAERGDLESVRFTVIANGVAPGKAGAIRAGLAELAEQVDVILLSDADVIFDQACLLELVRAFESEPELGMASAAQRFVRDLGSDGVPRAASGGALEAAGDLYDQATALVRRLESSAGLLFSVHGQCLAWRAELGLAPTPGIAADDLELRFRTRALDRPVRLVPAALFYERKTPRGQGRKDQALRRARAYFQVVWHGPRPAGRSWLERLQWRFYRHVPGWTPHLILIGALTAGGIAGWAFGAPGLGAVILILLLVLMEPRGRALLVLVATIWRARRMEARVPLSDRWEMQRS